MLFAKRVFLAAGVYGLIVILLGFVALIGGPEDWTANYPEYAIGFFATAFAWQVAFLVISTDPVRYRLLMIAAILEKIPYAVAIVLLYSMSKVSQTIFGFGLIDGLLGALFAYAYLATGRAGARTS